MREPDTQWALLLSAVLAAGACDHESTFAGGAERGGFGAALVDVDAAALEDRHAMAEAGAPLDASGTDVLTLAADVLDAAPGRLRFEVEGATAGIPTLTAYLLAGTRGEIAIDAYPRTLRAPLRHGRLPISFEGAFSAEFCAEVRRIAELSTRGEPFASQAERLLRRAGSGTAHVLISPWVGAQLSAAVADAARGAGLTIDAPWLANPLLLTDARIALVLEPDASARWLGVASIVQWLHATLQAQKAQALSQGVLTLAMPGKDLWCDVAEGKARLEIEVEGDVLGEPFQGTTIVEGMLAL